jgi:hypothetical protein
MSPASATAPRDVAWVGLQPRTPAEVFLCHVLDAAAAVGITIWLYGGYAMDVYAGRALRPHTDVDFLARFAQWPRLADRLASAEYRFDYAAPTALHVYADGQTVADVLLAEVHPEGFPFIRAPLGANPLPPGSLDAGPTVQMWGRRVSLVTAECLFVMKASGNFMAQAGAVLRAKDQGDLDLLRGWLTPAQVAALAPYCTIRPLP